MHNFMMPFDVPVGKGVSVTAVGCTVTNLEKEKLRPWFNRLQDSKRNPYSGQTLVLAHLRPGL